MDLPLIRQILEISMDREEKIGGVTLNYTYYSGTDTYSDGDSEEKLLKLAMDGTDPEEAAAADPDWSVLLLRYFNPIGAHPSGLIGEDPRGIPNNLMPYISQVAIGRLPYLNVFGDDYDTPDGTGIRDYIHVCDLASGHVAAIRYMLEHRGESVFNLGTGQGYSVLDIVKSFERVTGVKIPYKIGARRAGDLPVTYASPDKSAAILGWKAKYDLDDMCRDSWNWQKKNPNGYGDRAQDSQE